MRSRSLPRSAHARRTVLIIAVCLLGLSAALFAASALLQLSPDAGLRHAAEDLRSATRYPLLGGVLLALLYFVIQRAAGNTKAEGQQSMVFGDSTTMQELRDDMKER